MLHTMGFPEPEIFGFLYVYPNRTAALGVFVSPWMDTPVRTTYRYLQHWMMHPYIWRHLKGGKLLSWGAKSLQESGVEGEPFLVGDGYARIGEGAGTTDVLANAGVDEAWGSGAMLAEGVLKLLREGKPSVSTRLWSTWPVYTESLGLTGNFDYMEFVAEYAPFSQLDLENLARAAELYEMGSMIKVDLQNRF